MKFIKILGLIALSFSLIAAAQASPAKDEDFGIWSQNDIEAKVSKNVKLKAGEELRFREHAGIAYYDTHFGVSVQALKYLSLGAEYLQIRNTRAKGKKDLWFWEECPRIYLTPQIVVGGFKLEDRNMLEFRIKEKADNTLRYRNMATLTAPWKFTRFEFQPYAANETFFESDRNGFIEDRLYGGVRMHIWKGLQGSTFYLRQYSKNAAALWKESNILGIALKVVV